MTTHTPGDLSARLHSAWKEGRMVNMPHPNEPGKRVVGYVIEWDESFPMLPTNIIAALSALPAAGGVDHSTAMEGWHSALGDAHTLWANAPDDRYSRAAENVEDWIKRNRPTPQPSAAEDGFKADGSGNHWNTPDDAVGAQGEFAPTGNPQECETMAEAALLSERALWQDDEGVRWVPEACWQRALTEIERLEAAHAPPATTSAEEGNRG